MHLEVRIAKEQKISDINPYVRCKHGHSYHDVNPYWNYARQAEGIPEHLYERRNVLGQLSYLLEGMIRAEREVLNVSCLRDDQRLAGFADGNEFYDLLVELSQKHPDREFYVKWGGSRPNEEGRRFVFYVEDKEEAESLKPLVEDTANSMGIRLWDVKHRYGISKLDDYIDIDRTFRSLVRKPVEFARLLNHIEHTPHMLYEVFYEDLLKILETNADRIGSMPVSKVLFDMKGLPR